MSRRSKAQAEGPVAAGGARLPTKIKLRHDFLLLCVLAKKRDPVATTAKFANDSVNFVAYLEFGIVEFFDDSLSVHMRRVLEFSTRVSKKFFHLRLHRVIHLPPSRFASARQMVLFSQPSSEQAINFLPCSLVHLNQRWPAQCAE
jgi:hypothetical protein